MAKVINVTSEPQWKELLKGGTPAVAFFWADWHEPSKPGGQMDAVFNHLATLHPSLMFLRCEAEAVPEVSVLFNISVVPTFIFLRGGIDKVVDTLEGAHPGELGKKIQALTSVSNSPHVPSRSVSEGSHAATLAAISASKKYGGTNGFDQEERLHALINSAPVMLFMKGSPAEPRCGFSSKMVNILKEEGITFASFDILTDQDVRQGLKTLLSWPTYPMLIVNGELVGGLDIINEMRNEGEPLKEQLGIVSSASLHTDKEGESVVQQDTLDERLKKLVNQAPVMLFMKGSPAEPRCGFSAKIVDLLNQEGFTFQTFDILSDDDVRQGLKKYSDFPTFPQLYVDGELIGGLDIAKELHESGELAALKR